jgi:hypothetical protein
VATTSPSPPQLEALVEQLFDMNRQLWGVEDEIRFCERKRDFGDPFIELARSVYRLNDRRAAAKRQIAELLGSAIVEEKQYVRYE